jgi:hypothetical protein
MDTALHEGGGSQLRPKALELAIMRQIVHRTGGRIHMLEVEMLDDTVVIRGCALRQADGASGSSRCHWFPSHEQSGIECASARDHNSQENVKC